MLYLSVVSFVKLLSSSCCVVMQPVIGKSDLMRMLICTGMAILLSQQGGQLYTTVHAASANQGGGSSGGDARTNFLPAIAASISSLDASDDVENRASDESDGKDDEDDERASLTIFDDDFGPEWQRRWSWSLDITPGPHSAVYSGKNSLALTFAQPWGGYQILSNRNIPANEYDILRFWIHGGNDGVSNMAISAIGESYNWGTLVHLNAPAGEWSLMRIPLSDFKLSGPIQGFVLHQRGGIVTGNATFYIDDIKLVERGTTTGPIGTPVATKTATPISTTTPEATPTPEVTPTPPVPSQPTPVATSTSQPVQPPVRDPQAICGAMMVGVNLPSLNGGYGADFATVESWNNYHTYNANDARTMIAELANNGANSIRWWVFLDGRGAPEFDERGYPSGLDSTTLPSMADALVAAGEQGVFINFSLWSFEMLGHKGIGDTPSSGSHGELFYDDKAFDAYVQNVLIPMANFPTVDGYTIATHPNSMFEIINEPEWALNDTDQAPNAEIEDSISTPQLQKFIAKNVGVLHREGATMVGVGQAALKFIGNSERVLGGWGNLYEDSILQAYDHDGALDYYSPHYYDWMDGDGRSWNYNPYDYTKEQLGIDKPIIIGEIAAHSASYELDMALAQGYDGAWIWTYDGIDARGSWNDAKPAFQKFAADHPDVYGAPCDGE